jgi:hypothetical protein
MIFPIVKLEEVVAIVRSQIEIPPDLIVDSYDSKADFENGTIIFSGGVVARYGDSTLKTDTLILRNGTDAEEKNPAISIGEGTDRRDIGVHEAYAIGKVELIDPQGTIEASDLWLSWNKITRKDPKAVLSRGKNIRLKLGSLALAAESAEQRPTGWMLTNLSGQSGRDLKTGYRFSARSMNIVPGKFGVAKQVKFTMLGLPVPTIPSFRFSLDRRSQGVKIPQISYRQREGVGAAWNGNFIVNDRSQILSAINVFPRVLPSFNAYLATSKVKPEESFNNAFAPQNDFGERQISSYFESIYWTKPEDHIDFIRTKRNLVSAGSLINVGSFGRKSDFLENYSKALDVALERSGPMSGGSGFLYTLRGQTISRGGEAAYGRVSANGSLVSPMWKSGRLSGLTRLDAGIRSGVANNLGTSGWFGGESGVVYRPSEGFQFGVGLYGYQNIGTSRYLVDQFISDQGMVIRGDISGGATQISIMWRYDPTQGWFDRQMRISQVVGGLEPVFIYRANPNEVQLGLRFRIDTALTLLQNRQTKAKAKDNAKVKQ